MLVGGAVGRSILYNEENDHHSLPKMHTLAPFFVSRISPLQRGCWITCLGAVFCLVYLKGLVAQDIQQRDSDVKQGYLINVPIPLSVGDATALITQLRELNDSAVDHVRTTVVMQYTREGDGDDARESLGDETALEDGLRLARSMTGKDLRKLRLVSWLRASVRGHSILPIIASDMLIVGSGGQIEDASAGEDSSDETILLNYQSIAKRRGIFPPPVVHGLVDADLEVARVTKVGGQQSFYAGEQLEELRDQGLVLSEDILATPGVPLRLGARQLTETRIAASTADSMDELLHLLDLAELKPINRDEVVGEPKGALVDITGAIAPSRVRRWRSNLSKSITKEAVNIWVVSIDSTGGSLADSLTLAGEFAARPAPIQRVAGFVRGEARGDAALLAIACRPLLMKPGSRLGGSGGESLSGFSDRINKEVINEIAKSTKRSAALIHGLLDPQQQVFRFRNRKTGQIRYATDKNPDAEQVEADALNDDLWQRGEQVDLIGGLSAEQAIELGLAEGVASSLDEVSRKVGLPGTPPELVDNRLVQFVEMLGRSTGFSFFLFFIAISALSTEMNAPGLGAPGFIGVVCLALFVWMKFLAGTAEWFEIIALGLGLCFIAIEIFVTPGLGIFGIGGFILTMIGVVLMSQTFVLPRNTYQITQFTNGIWLALVGIGGLFGGFFAIRYFFPHVPVLSGLVMEAANGEQIEESEKLGDYAYLDGQVGTTTTPLHPAGKVKFGEEILSVVSDGNLIESGVQVRVTEVYGTRVIVELVE